MFSAASGPPEKGQKPRVFLALNLRGGPARSDALRWVPRGPLSPSLWAYLFEVLSSKWLILLTAPERPFVSHSPACGIKKVFSLVVVHCLRTKMSSRI